MALLRLRRPLLQAAMGGRAYYLDEFGTLSTRWTPVVGTLAVSGGELQAATQAQFGSNLVTNGESWTGGPPPTGWTGDSVTLTAVDSASDPGAASGGVDATAGKVVRANIVSNRFAVFLAPLVIGAQYGMSALCYSPSSNTVKNAAALNLSSLYFATFQNLPTTTEDTWQLREGTRQAITANGGPQIMVMGTTIGDIGYFDSVRMYRHNAAALLSGWSHANFTATLDHVSPAAPSIVPFGFVCRYTDALNYWEVRVSPNTAGNDLQIIQVTAGVQTVRAEADIDWTAGGTDRLEVTANGATISTRHWKHGAADWTAGPSYASATQGQTSPSLGVMLYGTGTGRLSRIEVTQ
jgi:hypothetical protein